MTNQVLPEDRLEKQCPEPWSLIRTEILQPITQIGQPTSKCKQKTIQTKETQGIYEKSTKCGHQRSLDKQHSIHKESQLTNRNSTKRGTSKPYPKNPYFQACTRLCIRATRVLYATVQESNPRMGTSVHDCAEKKPAYKYKFFLKK